jgi:hypothetical protein
MRDSARSGCDALDINEGGITRVVHVEVNNTTGPISVVFPSDQPAN